MIIILSLTSVALFLIIVLAYHLGYTHGERHAADDLTQEAAIAREDGFRAGYDQGYEQGQTEGRSQGFSDGRAYAEIAQHNAQIIDSKHGRVFGYKKSKV